MLIYLFLGGNWCIRGENFVGVGIVWMVASWMFPHEIDSSPISLAFSFAVSEVSCFVWSCISLYCVLFSVVIVYFMDVAWLLPYDYSLVLILHCCAIDASILYTKLFLLNVRLRFLLLLFLCISVLLLPLLTADEYDFSFGLKYFNLYLLFLLFLRKFLFPGAV